jgi:integrase
MFSWAIERGVYGLESAPTDRLKPAKLLGPPRARDRVLNDDELRALWRAAERMGYPYGALLKGLLFTGVRLNELAGARWREFDLHGRLWAIPSERFKMGQAHAVPLTDTTIQWLETLPRWSEGDYVFSLNGRRPMSGFSKNKAQLDQLMLRYWRALARMRGVERDALDPFVVHDLRRTVRTRLSALKVPERVAELVIGHSKKGLQRVYDQHEFIEEMREALAAWHAKLQSIVQPPPPNVVPMRKKTTK